MFGFTLAPFHWCKNFCSYDLCSSLSIVEVIVCMWISKTSSVCITCITVYHTYNMWTCIIIIIKHQFDWYDSKSVFQGHLICDMPLICQFILGGREGWMVFRVIRMIGNECNLFYTFLFIHYLPKNKTPFVEMVYLMNNYIIFSKGNKLLPASHCINWNINFN